MLLRRYNFLFCLVLVFSLSSSFCYAGFGDSIGTYRGETAYSNINTSYYRCEYSPNDCRSDWGIKWQCVEYVNRFYNRVLGMANWTRTGNAYEYWNNYSAKGLERYSNGGNVGPEVDDILVWNSNVGGGAGHVAIVTSVRSDRVTVIEQNWNNSNAFREISRSGNTLNSANLYGWLRKPGNTGGSKPDLVVREVNLNKTTLLPGESLHIETRIKNIGDLDIDTDFKIKYLLSNGTGIDSSPSVLADDNISSLDSDDSKWEDATVTAPLNPSTYNITVRADSSKDIDEVHESNNYFDPPVVITVTPPNSLPTGWLDSATCDSISGWARDPDTTSAIDVHVYANGPSGQGSYVIGAAASSLRSDLPYADKYHGYSLPTPAALKDGQPHSIYAYAIDSAGGTNPLLPGSPKTIICTPVDTTTPSVAITSPTTGLTYSTSSNSIGIAGTASDNVGVTEVTWSNNRGGSGTCSGTTSWSASGIPLLSGSNIITVTVKDAARNIQTTSLTVSLVSTFALNVTITGNGGGSISGDITCTSGEVCAPKDYVDGVNAAIFATPNAVSTFGGWSGSCTNTTRNCSVIMDTAKSVTATFTAAPKVKVGAKEFSSLHAAYADLGTQSGAIIKLLEGSLIGNFVANRGITVTIEGGHNGDFTVSNVQTVIHGNFRIRDGKVTVKGFIEGPRLVAQIPGDLNNDGKVDMLDLNILRSNYGQNNCDNVADINGDCIVDISDVSILASNMGRSI